MVRRAGFSDPPHQPSQGACFRMCLLQGEVVVVEEWLDVDVPPSGAIARCSIWVVDCVPSAFVLLELELAFAPLAPLE